MELGTLDELDVHTLEASTAEGGRRIFRRFLLLIVGLNLIIGSGMVVYSVTETLDTNEYLLETAGQRLVETTLRMRAREPVRPAAGVIADASALMGVPMALLAADDRVVFSTAPELALYLPEVFGRDLELGCRFAIRADFGVVSGAWVLARYDAQRKLLLVVPRMPSDEGVMRYMTVGAAVMGLGLAVSLLLMLAMANWVLNQPLRRLVGQLTGALRDDVEQRRRAEQQAVVARDEAEQHLAFRQNLIDASELVGIVATDPADRIQIFNRAAQRILGFAEHEMVGKVTLAQLQQRTRRPPSEELPIENITPSSEGELAIVDVRGEEHLLQANISEIVDAEKRRSGRLLIFIDITQRKRLEADLQLHQLQLIQASKMASLGEMATGVAHELNQPLNNIALLASRVARRLGALPAEDAEFIQERLEKIDGQVMRAGRIIDQLRTFGHPGRTRVDAVPLARPIHNIVDLLTQQFASRGITLSVEVGDDVPAVSVDEAQLEQVLINLLNNARDAFDQQPEREDRRVRISAWRGAVDDEEGAVVQVSDNGPGIAEEALERVFQPFYTTKEVGKGTGLGLPISYSLVRGFGGKLAVRSSTGAGAVFTVLLPAATRTTGETPASADGDRGKDTADR